MTYFQMGDDHLARLEESGLSNDAILLEVQAFNHAAKSSSDGHIRTRLSKLIDAPDPNELAAQLVAKGFWEVTDDGYYCVNYLHHNLSAEMVDMAREGARERKERSRRHKLGDHSMCIRGNYCPGGEVEPKTRSNRTNVTRDGTRDRTPIQDKTMQGNSRSISLETKDGAPTDAPSGALVVAPSMGEWPHPYLFDTSPNCLICGKEKSPKHIEPELVRDFHLLLDWLNWRKNRIEISHNPQAHIAQLNFLIKRTTPETIETFRSEFIPVDHAKQHKELQFYEFTGSRVITQEFAQALDASDAEDEGRSPIFTHWISRIVKPLERVKWIDISNIESDELWASWFQLKHWITGDYCDLAGVTVTSTSDRHDVVAERIWIDQMMNGLASHPEPDLQGKVESNEMEKING